MVLPVGLVMFMLSVNDELLVELGEPVTVRAVGAIDVIVVVEEDCVPPSETLQFV
jgi:hypothetical protein